MVQVLKDQPLFLDLARFVNVGDVTQIKNVNKLPIKPFTAYFLHAQLIIGLMGKLFAQNITKGQHFHVVYVVAV